MIEAAIIAPLVLLLTFSIIEFSTLLFVYLALASGVSQATRYGVTGNSMASMSRPDSIVAAMREATPALTLPDESFSFSHMPPGAGGWISGPGGPGDIQKLTVDYTWTVLTPLLRPFFAGGQMHLKAESAMKNEDLFQ